jgi:hypothetical protein
VQLAEIATDPNLDTWGTPNGTDIFGPDFSYKPQVRERLHHILLDDMKMPVVVFSCKEAVVRPVYAMAHLKSSATQPPHDTVELPDAQPEPLVWNAEV